MPNFRYAEARPYGDDDVAIYCDQFSDEGKIYIAGLSRSDAHALIEAACRGGMPAFGGAIGDVLRDSTPEVSGEDEWDRLVNGGFLAGYDVDVIDTLLRNGSFIAAIKFIRAKSQMNLKPAHAAAMYRKSEIGL